MWCPLTVPSVIVPDGFSIGFSDAWVLTETMIAGADIWSPIACHNSRAQIHLMV
jgi:hypothetical protein